MHPLKESSSNALCPALWWRITNGLALLSLSSELSQSLEAEEKQASTAKTAIEQHTKAAAATNKRIAELTTQMRVVANKLEGLVQQEREQQKKMAALTKEIDVIAEKLLHPPSFDLSELDRELAEQQEERSEVEKIIEEIAHEKQQIMVEGQSLNRQINEVNER